MKYLEKRLLEKSVAISSYKAHFKRMIIIDIDNHHKNE